MHATFSLFPKFFQHLSADELAETVHRVGLDTVNLVIRNGFWVELDDFANTCTRFMATMRKHGLNVHFATAGFSTQTVRDREDLLEKFAAEGIRAFRLNYFDPEGDRDPRGALDRAKAELASIVPACEAHGLRAVYQVHHGRLIASASAAADVVAGLPPEHIGVMLDPGNQAFEGYERWSYAASLLGEHFVAAGIKDVAWSQDPAADGPRKGWRQAWAGCDEGVTDWHAFIRACDAVGFDGTFVFMPFYHEDDPAEMERVLTREVAYLRRVIAEVTQERKSPTD